MVTKEENEKKQTEVEQVQSRSGKREVKAILKTQTSAGQNETVLLIGSKNVRPKKIVKTVYRPKPISKPNNTCTNQLPVTQRLPAEKDNKDKDKQEEVSPQELKTKTSCHVQQIKTTNRFAVLDIEVEA